jgi:hypothetical protein
VVTERLMLTSAAMASTPLPWWARALIAVDDRIDRFRKIEGEVRDELFFLLTSDAKREELTIALYDRRTAYLPRSRQYDGLHEWEVRFLRNRNFPQQGRILLGAAGGGRELRALTRLGYEVDAFEPAPTLLAGARTVISPPGRGRVELGSYRSLIDGARGEGPLAEMLRGARYDAIVFGWGSFSHVYARGERRALLETMRRLCPEGPVALSFDTTPREKREPRSPTTRFLRERVLPHVRRARGELQPLEPLAFWPGIGFLVAFDRARIEEEARDSGYRVETFAAEPYGHALLLPTG